MISYGDRGLSILAKATVAALVFLASMAVATGTSHGYNGLPRDLSNYQWVGSLDASMSDRSEAPQPAYVGSDLRYESGSGTLDYTHIKPLSGWDINGLYASDLKAFYTWERYSCNPLTLDSTVTASWDGPWGRVEPKWSFSLESTPEGFLFLPFDLVLPWASEVEPATCNNLGLGYSDTGHLSLQSFPDDFYTKKGPTPTLLRQDTDPDPYHLVGSTTWTLADPPDGVEFPMYPESPASMVAYTYTINYDLRLIARPRAKIGRVTVRGPAHVKKGKAANYRVRIPNVGNAAAKGVRLKVRGRGVRSKAWAGNISPGEARTIVAKLRPKKPGRIKVFFRVTPYNAVGRTATKRINVRRR